MTEAEFQAQVIEVAQWSGWPLIYHTHDSRRSAPGFPDLVLARPGQLIFAELKTSTGHITPAQTEWHTVLRTVQDATADTVQAHIWRPDQFNTITRTLNTRSHP